MKIGIDISQTAYANTGVANYLTSLVQNLLEQDSENEYVLFFSGFRRKVQSSKFKVQNHSAKFKIKTFPFPPKFLDLLWNKLHIIHIEALIGDVDIFITSDWSEPPAKRAKKATILYDLIIYKYPEETAESIISVQKRKLEWVKKESTAILCISESTRRDANEILNVSRDKLHVIYPGFSLSS
jgi:hypothetical protein